MAKRNWKRFHSKSYDEYGIINWDNLLNPSNKVTVSKWDFDKSPNNYQISITGLNEARKGYPNSKVGISKKEAMKRARKYMIKNR